MTFVAEVTEPALSLLVPILDKSLKMSSSSNEQLRQTVMVTENLTRLVNNKEIEQFIPICYLGWKKLLTMLHYQKLENWPVGFESFERC